MESGLLHSNHHFGEDHHLAVSDYSVPVLRAYLSFLLLLFTPAHPGTYPHVPCDAIPLLAILIPNTHPDCAGFSSHTLASTPLPLAFHCSSPCLLSPLFLISSLTDHCLRSAFRVPQPFFIPCNFLYS